MNPFAAACKNLALIVHMGKTVVMNQPPPYAAYNASKINVNGAQLQATDNFMYLDSTLSCSAKIDDEVAHWVSKASQAFGPDAAKWIGDLDVYTKEARRLNHSHLSCLRWILKLRWQDWIRDTDVLEQTRIISIYAMLRQLQLHWCGRIVRMDDERLPKRLFYEDVATGSRRQGGQVRRYKDTLKCLQINPANLEDVVRDRPGGEQRRQVQQSTKPTASPTPKLNVKLTNLNCVHLGKPTITCPRPTHDASGLSGLQSV
ncbi:hypothetical protein SprV_0301305400 [Sparganum proliferum]